MRWGVRRSSRWCVPTATGTALPRATGVPAAWLAPAAGLAESTAMRIIPRSEALLPAPEPRPVHYTVISVDDHLVEPPDMFEGRLPARFAELAPRIIENEHGHQVWLFEGGVYTQVAMNAVSGRRPEFIKVEPTRFEDMRRGCWDIDAR